MVEVIYNYFNNNARLSDEQNKKLLTFIGAVSLNVDYEFSFKDKVIENNFSCNNINLTKEEEFKLFCINKALDKKETIINIPSLSKMFYDLGNTHVINAKDVRKYFQSFFEEYEKSFKDYTYDRIVYYNDNAFYIHFEEELTKEELELLKNTKTNESTHFEVFKDENGKIYFF